MAVFGLLTSCCQTTENNENAENLIGKSNIIIPLNAQQSYINTRFGYIQTLTEYQTSVSNLERAIGAGQ